MQRQTLKPFPEEPNTDTVPAMLTPGEFVIRKDAVDAIGVDKLNLMNNIDRLSMLSSLMEYRPSGYQEGGEVMLKTKKENLPNAGLKALFDSGAKGKEALGNMGFQQGGTVMDYYGGGMVKKYQEGGKVISDTLDVFGDKSSAADSLNSLININKMQSYNEEALKARRQQKQEQERQRLIKLREEGNEQTRVKSFRGGIDEAIPEGMQPFAFISNAMAMNRAQGIISDFPYLPLDDVMHKYDISEDELPFFTEYFESVYEDRDDLDKEQQDFLNRAIEYRVTNETQKERIQEKPMRKPSREALGESIIMGFQQGGQVMNYYGGGRVMDMMNPNMMRRGMMGGGKVESDALSVFGDKSAAADKMNMVMTLQSMRMQQGGMVPGMIPPQEMPAPSLPPAGMMMQEGGMVEQPMPQGEPMGMDMPPMPTGERAFPAASPMEQLDLKPNEMMAYEQYGPDTFRYMATKFKPRSEFTPYDAMVDAGIVDPYETSEDDFVVMTRNMANDLRGMDGV